MNGYSEDFKAQGAYTVTYISCRVCGSDRPKLLGIRGNLEYSGAASLEAGEPHMVTNVVQCRNCGFVYTNPLILLAVGDARQRYHDAQEYLPYANDPSRELKERLATLERLAKKKGRLLDIGAGKGEFLAIARQRGWEVEGVEPSEDMVRHAQQQHQLTLRYGALEQAAFPDGHFDAVTLNMVLEHVDDPHGLLQAIYRVLAPGGLLFVEVPNMESFMLRAIRWYFRLRRRNWSPMLSPLHWPYHCFGYRLQTLQYLCARHGFRVVKAQTQGLGPRGFRPASNVSLWERWLRSLAMQAGNLLGQGDVLRVYCRKAGRPQTGARVPVQPTSAACLYITYDGLLDPLGRSQVLPYILRLNQRGWRLIVLSFEKPEQRRRQAFQELWAVLAARGIEWHPLRYHKTPAVIATSYDVLQGFVVAIRLIWMCRIRFVHARSYVASVIALGAKQLTGCKFLFDMRGLWADERVDGEWWRQDSPLFKIAKRFEASFFRHADHVVVLTSGLKSLLSEWPVVQRRPGLPISVIPTCVDLTRFDGGPSPDTPQAHVNSHQFTYVYLGSVGPLYLLNEVVRFFRMAVEVNSRAFLLVITNGPEHDVHSLLAEHGVPRDRYKMLNVPHEEVPRYLADAQASLFFTKPCYSRIAKYSTKFGESLASGLPVVTNRGSVDIEGLLEQHRVGIVIDELTQEAYRDALERLEELMSDPGLPGRCRQVAADHLSLERGVCAYERIYSALSSGAASRSPEMVER